ncbi:MAG: alpha/beta fold hydrolase [Atopobiaceae bacterium]|nr:alpha/beta fold hydrolase [Atopobiaceae bacterium]
MPETAAAPLSGTEARIVHREIRIPSTRTGYECVGDLWVPAQGRPKAVLQICHGMVEYVTRYEHFACTLVENGYAVCGIDHMGHGRTTPDPAERGVYDTQEGARILIEDQHRLRLAMQEGELGGIPYFLMGHSMGSFIARCYLARHGRGLAGAIIMGTAWQDPLILAGGKLTANVIGRFKGWDYRSKLLDNLGVGAYNKAFEGTGAKTGVEWLSRDVEHCKAYKADPDCGWMFSVSGYMTLFNLLTEAQDTDRIKRIPAELPVLFISGSEDPVGEMGKGPARTFKEFKDAGVVDCELVLEDGGRHEILGELNKEEVEAELLAWLDAHV